MLVPTLRRLDGVAETRELRDRGIRPTQLAAAVAAEDVLRVRRGWYALPETPAALLTAVRIGGRLACVSAAAHYGWATPERHAVHVCVAENASRLRRPPDGGAVADLHVEAVVHWGSPIPRRERPRLITSRFETVCHLVACLDPEHAVAALDSFLHTDPGRSTRLEEWLTSLPPHILGALASRSDACESFLETIGRIRTKGDQPLNRQLADTTANLTVKGITFSAGYLYSVPLPYLTSDTVGQTASRSRDEVSAGIAGRINEYWRAGFAAKYDLGIGRWVLMQGFAGRADKQAGYAVAWLNGEVSLVRGFGAHSQTCVQLGVRRTVSGRNVPQVTALVASLWRRY